MQLKGKLRYDLETGCLNWTGYVFRYPMVKVNGKKKYLHRVMWEEERGPIPRHLEVHHTCHNKRCVNPDHMELVNHMVHISNRHRALHPKD